MLRKKTWLFSVLIGFLSFILVRIWHQTELHNSPKAPRRTGTDDPDR